MTVTIYNAFNRPPRQQAHCGGKSRTQKHFAPELDINRILEKTRRTGAPPPIKQGGIYGDFSNVGSYAEALAFIRQADKDFQTLPSKVREHFNNDPAALLVFLQDENNRAEAAELGIIPKPPPATPIGPDGIVDAPKDIIAPIVTPK